MIFTSIRWRLQLWYGLILLAVLAGFGVTAYELERGRQFRHIDDELRARGDALEKALRPPPRFRGPGDGPPDRDRPPEPSRFSPQVEPMPPGRRFDGGEPGQPGPHPPPREFRLPPRLVEFFDETDTNAFYYVILGRDGNELSRSTNAPPQVPMGPPPAGRPRNPLPAMGGGLPRPQLPELRTRGSLRELMQFTPPGEVIVVGRSIAKDLNDLRLTALTLAGVGGGILLLGLAGGWWLATRAIQPINNISATAVKISGGDLSRRIDVGDTDNELGRLAGVLNSTFARLEAAFAQQQQFTSDAAHELRTPVSVMLTQAQTALSRERSAAEYRDTLEACERSAQRMRRLTESLMELARLDAGQEKMKRAPFDLARTAADCVDHVRPLAAKRGITIHAECPTTRCVGDAERLAQVITNLLTNAIHHNKDGGEVRLSTGRERDFATLTIADTGQGIAPEHLPHVFERFYRADPARSASQGGAGLGLAISKAIVDAHGGSIDVRSESGAGATFTVRLPMGV